MLEEWKESIILPIYENGDKTDTVLPTTYKTLSIILLSRLTPHAEEILGVYQSGFQRNALASGHVFCIHQIHEKKLESVNQSINYFKTLRKPMIQLRRRAFIIV